jgi:hypothetical protein
MGDVKIGNIAVFNKAKRTVNSNAIDCVAPATCYEKIMLSDGININIESGHPFGLSKEAWLAL